MAHNFPSIPTIALETVTGGADDGTDTPSTDRDDDKNKKDTYTTGGGFGNDGPFTTGGGF